MANAEIEVSVALEVALHNTVREFMQDMSDQYGVMIEMAEAQWVDVSTIGAPKYLVTGLRLQTSTNGPTNAS